MISVNRWGACLGAALLFSGCANLNSIGRSTQLSRDEHGGQLAVHVDAKQRLVYSKDAERDARLMLVCAEPSPDALSAYAQSLGLSVAIPTQGSVTGSQASQETAAMIGIRTQAITLMRDALYRVCEAYYNRALNGPQVLQVLTHAQDITVAILAIEQLTGVTAAQPVILGGTANSVASAQIAYVQALLDGAKENLTNREKDLTTATAEVQSAESARNDAKKALDSATDATKKVSLEATFKQREAELASAQAKKATAEVRAADAKTVKESIEKNPTSAFSSSGAAASGTGQFGNTIMAVKLDAASTQKIAEAVQAIVTRVVDKKYTADACMAYLTRNWDRDELAQQHYIDTLELCRSVVRQERQLPPPPK
jgi:hypothetical protein